MPGLSAVLPPPLRQVARAARRLVRRLAPASVDQVLAPADCRAVLTPLETAFLPEVGSPVNVPLRVEHHGHRPWAGRGRHPVRFVGRWLTPKRQPVGEPVSARLPDLYPGQVLACPATLPTPPAVGHYLLELDLEQVGGDGFQRTDRNPLLLDVQVTGRAADDIDYYKVFATADLSRDHWTSVGPSTREEYDRLAVNKLGHLRDFGFTPDSRVLDVGCGTGQLGTALEPILSDRGCYVGTDIGPEAVAFCRQRFTRPNFRFHVNDMTRLPIRGEAFDYVTFFSVFTHTFPDETALLLHEAARLLAPGGVILGDVFVNPHVERCGGHRGRMELERDHFLRLVSLVGLTAEVYQEWEWQGGPTRRAIYAYRRA
jgi:SAM-dependent methyltransferase